MVLWVVTPHALEISPVFQRNKSSQSVKLKNEGKKKKLKEKEGKKKKRKKEINKQQVAGSA
jgi:hypothetical protein